VIDAERVADEIGDRWFHSTILVDRAHVALSPDTARRRRPPRSRIHRRFRRQRMIEWRIKEAPRCARQARRPGGVTPNGRSEEAQAARRARRPDR
jgi:hypothetical protein